MPQGSTQALLDPSIGTGQMEPEQQPPVPGLGADASVLDQPAQTDPVAEKMAMINSTLASTNLADNLTTEELREIGLNAVRGFEVDLGTLEEWLTKFEEYIKLATMVSEKKTFPWKDAANVKYPLLATASMQFAARAYQTLIPTPKAAKANVIGEDPKGLKAMRAKRVGRYMSYQLLEEMEDWEDHMDRLCLALPMVGNMFKKTYYKADGTCCSELVMPTDLIVNYSAKSLEKAPRKTHILRLFPNDIESNIRTEMWMAHEYQTSENKADDQTRSEVTKNLLKKIQGVSEPGEEDPQDLDSTVYLEQHTYLDLDEDGYDEPVIVTVCLDTKEVVSIYPCYYAEGISTNKKGVVTNIKPAQYFTNFIFIPNPLSGVYGLGLGHLLGSLNEAANTALNQLFDAGTISNLQSGFIAKGIRIQHGNVPLRPGEWRSAQTTGDDLRKGIVPLPAAQPSPVLFQLLGMIVESGFTLGSNTDLMQGKSPGQNQPFSTTSAMLQQGLQMYSSIHKRMFRSLKKEYQKIFKLNGMYLDDEKYFTILDPGPEEKGSAKIGRADFNDKDFDVVPAGDPNQLSSVERLEKAQQVFAMVQMGMVNPQVAAKRLLEIMEVDGIQELLTLPKPEPSFDQQIELQKIELLRDDQEIAKMKAQYQGARDEANSMLAMAKAQSEQLKGQEGKIKMMEAQQKIQFEQLHMRFELILKEAEMKMAGMKHDMDMEKESMKQQSAKIKMLVDSKKASDDIAVSHAKAKAGVRNAKRSTEDKAD